MNKKKIVKPIIAAAAAAAIAGIGAVSFAAWSASNSSVTTSSNTTGKVSVLEFDAATANQPGKVENLLPIDQNGTTPEYKTVTFKINKSAGYAYSDFKLNVKYGTTAPTLATASGIYVSKTVPSDTTPTGSKVDSTGVDVTFNLSDASSDTYTLYVWLESDDTADMNVTFDLIYTLADGTTAVSGS